MPRQAANADHKDVRGSSWWPCLHILWRLSGPEGIADVQVSGRFSGDTAQAIRMATVAGLGIALLPHLMTRLDVEALLLVPVLPQYQRESHGMSVLYPSRRHVPLAVSVFNDFVTERIGEVEATFGE